jgi:RNA polymerase sigma-B factor
MPVISLTKGAFRGLGEVASVSSTQQHPGAETRQRLIESHLPLVKALARRYAGPGAELDDLVQVGAVGLIKASDRFDPEKGVAFATFAAPTIEGEIRHHLRDRGSALRIPRPLQDLGRRIQRCQGELTVSLGRSPTMAEVAASLKVSEDEVEQALAATRARDAVPLAAEEWTRDAAEEPGSGSDTRLMLASSLRALDERQRQIIYLRFHADKTERQIAGELGISQAHVSRLLASALGQLREGLEAPPDTTPHPVVSPADRPQKRAKRAGRTRTAPPPRTAQAPLDDAALRSAIEAWIAAERDNADTAEDDAPKERKSHSGRFLVRMPGALHEELARAAEREQVSLNRFVTDALATTVSQPSAPQASQTAPGEPHDRTPPPVRTIRMVLAANLAIVIVSLAVAAVLLVLALQRGI